LILRIARFLLLAVVFAACYSCGSKSDTESDHLVFRYNEIASISSLDPAFARNQAIIWTTNQIYNGLVQLDDSLHVQPDIAKSWTLSEDGTRYTFILRNDVWFHKDPVFGKDSTRRVNARDVVYSLNRLRDEQVASPGSWIMQSVDHITAVNDSTVSISLNKPFSPFLGLLAMKYASVVPREAVEYYGSGFRSHPVGTGPFAFKFWEENVKLVLRRNPLYFEKDAQGNQLPYLEAVAVTFLPDRQSGFLQFIQGKNDFTSGLDPSYKDELLTQTGELQKKYRGKVNMQTGPYLNTEYLGFKMDGPEGATMDKRIRQAMNYGFDRSKLVLYLRNNMGIPAMAGMIPAGLPGYGNVKGYDYDLNKAKALISEYKKATGDVQPKISLSTNASYIDIAEFLQREWQKAGLQVEIDISPPSTLRTAISTGKVSFFRASWIADYPDAENYLSLFYSKNHAPNGPNTTHFSSRDFDRLYEEAAAETDDQKRYALYAKMDQLVIDEAPVIPLFYDKVARFTGTNISGLGINPLNMLTLKYVRKAK
jgi:ABC-type transport system substrate-binding protein